MKVLTGKVRCRILTRYFRKTLLVQQVEEQSKGVHDSYCVATCSIDDIPYDRTYWRDATVEDLQ
jgi:hypothetical protein